MDEPLNRSRLHERHADAGAAFCQHGRWTFPACFSSVDEEYRALQEDAGLIDLPASGLIELTGPDRVRFLHGMVSNDIKSLPPGAGCYAAMLTPQGRLLADMRIYCLPDSLLISADWGLCQKLPPLLKKYIIADRVTLNDTSDTFAVISVQGPKAAKLLEKAAAFSALPTLPFSHGAHSIRDVSVRICSVRRTTSGGFDLILQGDKLDEVWNHLVDSGRELGVRPAGLSALQIQRVEAGIPWYGIDMDETSLAVEAGLQEALSFDKGCYIGQEIVARATHRGHVNWKLKGLLLSGGTVASQGDKLFWEDKEAGWVTSSVFSPRLNRSVAMGYVRREHEEMGTRLELRHQDDRIDAEVVQLPLVSC
ncbi:MAG: aminomethyltransferase family protein [Acidobacteriota bacterium]